MTKRVVVTDHTFPLLAAERSAAEKAGASLEAHQCRDADTVAAAVDGADVVVVQFAPMTARAIAGLKDGARIIRYGVGFDNIDVAAARKRAVDVAYVPDYCTDEVADHTATLILALLRKLSRLDTGVRAGRWTAVKDAAPLPQFEDTTVGFIGLGRIGRAVLERLRPFRFRFLVFDPAPGDLPVGAERAHRSEDVLSAADAITLHAPSTPTTRGMINAETLKRMKPTAFLVNTARGDLIDEAALADALAAGTIAGAALDVFQTEPLPATSPLRTAPNLTLSPHAAWYSDASIGKLQSLAADEITRALAGAPARCPVPV
jgi:D-3-phosphoglycerate dehydrogenase / 2-oxoglutarate reductase